MNINKNKRVFYKNEQLIKKRFLQFLALFIILIGIFASCFSTISALDITFAVIGICLIWVAFQRPAIFFTLALWTNFLKSVYIPKLDFGKYGIAPYMLFTALAAMGYGFQVILGRKKIIIPPGFVFLLIFIGGTTVSSPLFQEPQMTLGVYVRDILQWILFFLAIQIISNRQALKRLVDALLAQAVVIISWGIITGVQINYLGTYKMKLLFWRQFQKNEYATYLSFILVLALAVISVSLGKKIKLRKYTAFTLIVLIPIAWMFTYSRSGFVGIISAAFVFLVLDRGKKILRLLLQWGPIVALIAFIIILALSSEARDLAIDGVLSLLNPLGASSEALNSNVAKRLELMSTALKIIVNHPLFGIDYSQWLKYSPFTSGHFDPQLGKKVSVGQGVHNRYLSIAVQNGLITLFGYLAFLFTTFQAGLRARRYAKHWLRTYINAFLAAFVGYQLAVLFLPEFLWEWPILGILLGLINIAGLEAKKITIKKARFKLVRFGSDSTLANGNDD